MFTFMIVLFVIGYACIALEHPLKINKSASALLLAALLWVCAVIGGESLLLNDAALRDNYPCLIADASWKHDVVVL